MRALIDTNALIEFLDPRTPKGRADRLKGLLEDIDSSNGKLIIPVQVVGEYVAGAGPAGRVILDRFLTHRRIEVASFDHVAAIECALMDRKAQATGDKRFPLSREAIWQKVKVDRQIVAIDKVLDVDLIVSSDGDIPKIANTLNIRCCAVKDLQLPAWAQQLQIEGVVAKSVQLVPQPVAASPRRLVLGRRSSPGQGEPT